MKKIITAILILGSVSLIFNDTKAESFGFTCCDEEDSQCIYEEEIVKKDAYYKSEGKCNPEIIIE